MNDDRGPYTPGSLLAVGQASRGQAIRAVMAKDLTAIRRSKGVMLPMVIVPTLLLVVLPLAISLAAVSHTAPDAGQLLKQVPSSISHRILHRPPREHLVLLVDGYLLASLFLIVPLMVASVVAADAFAGEKERRTLEGLLHLPIAARDLFYAKVLAAFVPAVLVSWVGFCLFAAVVNTTAWPVMHRLFVPTRLWGVMIFWVGPAVAALGLGIMVRVSARARSTQEANQLGGAVITPLIALSVVPSTGLLLVADLPVAFAVGSAVWLLALGLTARGAARFTRDRMALSV